MSNVAHKQVTTQRTVLQVLVCSALRVAYVSLKEMYVVVFFFDTDDGVRDLKRFRGFVEV